jgi:hypothetical protein
MAMQVVSWCWFSVYIRGIDDDVEIAVEHIGAEEDEE